MGSIYNRGRQTARPARKQAALVTTDDTRAIYNAANEKAKAEGLMATPGYLRIEKLIVGGQNRYQFSILKDSNSDSITERKLDRNDKFTITELGIFLMKRSSSTKGIEVLQTYPNATVFAASTGVLNPAHLEAIYNGNLSLSVASTKFIEGMDLNRFRMVPQLIQSASAANSQRSERDGFTKLTPQVTINGDVKTSFDIEVPTFAGMEVGTDCYLVLIARGFQITAK